MRSDGIGIKDNTISLVPCLPLSSATESVQTDGVRCICVKLEALEVSAGEEALGSDDEEYRCQMLLYCMKNHQFLGNVWNGKHFNIQNGKVLLNETVYFYSRLSTKDLLLSLEVVGGTKTVQAERVTAWGAISLSSIDGNIPESGNSIQYRIPLHHGSCASLLFMNEVPERLSQAKDLSVLELVFSLAAHPHLMRLVHIIPENFLVGASDPIVGLFQTKKDFQTGHDTVKRAQLQKCCTVLLGSVTIKITPSVSAFETEVVKKLLEEKEIADASQFTGEMAVLQRHLQVGVHNGLCYTQESDSYRLLVEPATSQGSATQRSSSSSSVSFSRDEHLVIRSDVKIPNVPDDPETLIIFVVEYLLMCKEKPLESSASGGGLGRSFSSSVSVMWGMCPLSRLKTKSAICVPLQSDPCGCPNKTLLLKVGSFSFTLTCSVLSSRKNAGYLSSEYPTLAHEGPLPYSESLEAVSVPSQLHQVSKDARSFIRRRRSRSHSALDVTDGSLAKASHQKKIPLPAEQDSEGDAMKEVSVVPSSVPFVTPPVHQYSMSSRVHHIDYSEIFSMKNFRCVVDHQGNPPTVIDPSEPYMVELRKESPMEGSKVVFQFLGLSGRSSNLPEMLFLVFRFYRFPSLKTENIYLKSRQPEQWTASSFHVMYTKHLDHEEGYGCQITYYLDPADFSPGEYKPFLDSLSKGTMPLDVYDAKSLLYFGTAMIPMKYLCRQGKDAVCINLTLDVQHMEFPDNTFSGGVPVDSLTKAQLHLQMSSVRVPLTSSSLSKLREMSLGGDETLVKPRKVPEAHSVFKASPILETNKELSNLMSSRCFTSSQTESSVMSEEKKRKLARMEAVRSSVGDAPATYSTSQDIQSYFKERQRDLAVIDSFIEKNKNDLIKNLLQASLTTEMTLCNVVGEKTFFEFEVTNPYNSDLHVFISWSCPHLSLVTEKDEEDYLRMESGLAVTAERMPMVSSKGTSPVIILHAKESIKVPFKYYAAVSSEIASAKPVEVLSGHHLTSDTLNNKDFTEEKEVKVSFQSGEHNLISALFLKVHILPPTSITHTFRFLCPEHSVFQKTVVIKSINRKPHVLCSDPDVMCELLQEGADEPFTLVFKAQTGSLGKTRKFHIFIYDNRYMCRPVQTWLVQVLTVQRVDVSCVSGQTSRSSLILRGGHTSRLVCCYSDSGELSLNPSEPFILNPCSIQELVLSLRCLLPGVGYFRISMVDQGIQEVVSSWLLLVNCQKPLVTKAFQVRLHCYKEAVKRISIHNTSSEVKHYNALCSHQSLLHLRDSRFAIGPSKTYSLGLYFPPQDTVLSETVFLYLCDDSGRNEETYCIKVNCG